MINETMDIMSKMDIQDYTTVCVTLIFMTVIFIMLIYAIVLVCHTLIVKSKNQNNSHNTKNSDYCSEKNNSKMVDINNMNVFDFNNMREFFVVTYVKNSGNIEVSHKTEYFFSKKEANKMVDIYFRKFGTRGHVFMYHIKDGHVINELYMNDRCKNDIQKQNNVK